MAEYISKEYLIARFKELANDYLANDYTGEKRQRGLAYATAADMFALMKSADVQPVVHGRWIISNIYAKCSECSVAYDLDTFMRLIPMHENVPRHCSYCGARMIKDGDANDT